nr:hypothetical protein [Tanacetum cinerariifolium]
MLELGVFDETAHVVVVMFDETTSELVKYMLEFGVFDETAHVVVVMFDETTSELVKCSSNLTAHIHTAEMASESACSSTVDAITNPQTFLGKRLCKKPSISNPLKPFEEKKNI